MQTIDSYVKLARINKEEESVFFQNVHAVKDCRLVKDSDIEILVDIGGELWPSRIVLLDRYDLAQDFEINGCSCCQYPDYILHFTSEIETSSGKNKVYLRTKNWTTRGTEDEEYHHATKQDDCKILYFDASRSRIPDLLSFYRKNGVPDTLLKRVEEEIFSLIELEEESYLN